ncbi:11092_t:CDS:2 [Ambispora leptoticha]|uniref:11092_t:CDS:1 n=1 Tax=Ambispora leptoticha TaxID=144679 RepID=A0A9N9F5E1_9GLOM|nr:11092_t:CDS:2 [Ambispora leptoticha]
MDMNITSSLSSSYQHDVASYVAGSISIACWIVVLVPQLYTNYRLKSGESLSTTFLLIWFAADALNLAGAIIQNLLLTMIVLAFYYNLTDVILLCQVYYYRFGRRPSKEDEELVYATEETPLVPQHHHRPASMIGHESSYNATNVSIDDENYYHQNNILIELFASLLCVVVTGLVSYYHYSAVEENIIGDNSIMNRFAVLNPSKETSPSPSMILLGQSLGWGSAVLYLGSRIPQIVMNGKNRSCEGLSLTMFFFSVLGNLTYCLSILFHSVKREFILNHLPWLIGSGGTLLFDFMIFVQFYLYRNSQPQRRNRRSSITSTSSPTSMGKAVDIKQKSEPISSTSSPPPSYSEIV